MDNVFTANLKKAEISKYDETLLESIRQAKLDMDTAIGIFNTCIDPKLIDIAIYEENVARTKLDYLILEAKKRGLKFNFEIECCNIENVE
ncbi:YaaL family protein [Inconstantimicrobium mannanitabidum]|uniref:Uncharacterized protein n=1 Tax=Inconstantimicrobium mannanitabidum TaxID=1604901 RepID=A0ACB5RH03_9CLOT|nr:YaaL family protein [Clostridium sp. TW13]GKX68358.1 hypothetical protein rsdtw13_36160 [Clostridium sp. TW13]